MKNILLMEKLSKIQKINLIQKIYQNIFMIIFHIIPKIIIYLNTIILRIEKY